MKLKNVILSTIVIILNRRSHTRSHVLRLLLNCYNMKLSLRFPEKISFVGNAAVEVAYAL